MAIFSNCSKLRRVLFNRDDILLGHTGHNKGESDSLSPFASVLDVFFELLRVFIRDVLTRMAYPELFQVPGLTKHCFCHWFPCNECENSPFEAGYGFVSPSSADEGIAALTPSNADFSKNSLRFTVCILL